MTNNSIPPYQAIDILLQGNRIPELPEPQAGYVVLFPDTGLSPEYFTEETKTEEKLEELKTKSKWPDCVYYRPCWIHGAQIVYDGISKKRYWTPR